MNTSDLVESSIWDLTLLQPATLQFLVVSDTHFLLPDNAQSAEWESVREFPDRTARALRMAGALPHNFAVHLGDISHEYPETGRAKPAQKAALEQFQANGLSFYQAAGNMDIGDKPDPTSPAGWVTAETLRAWHEVCGRSWHSFDFGGVHGIVLNTQIMNGPLPEASEQVQWAESDLNDQAGKRIFLFLHMPVYYVDRSEHSLGFYNSLDEPARSWILDLIERYSIELVFAGHTHTVMLNRHGGCRMYVAPSTAASRAGLAEAYSVVSPDQGRGDIDKLGFYFVRLTERGTSVHLIRSGRDNPALDRADSRRMLLTRTSRDLPHGRLGIVASHPLGHPNPGPIIWPSIVRQPVRDDFRLMSIVELGARVARVPASDLMTSSESERLAVLRDESVSIESYWMWSDRVDLEQQIRARQGQIDAAEIVLPGHTLPSPVLLPQIKAIRESDIPVTLSPAIVDIGGEGQYHQRTRVGYLPEEIDALTAHLEEHGAAIDRAACRVRASHSAWQEIDAFREFVSETIAGLDFYLDFPGEDDAANANLAAEAMAATATIASARLVLGPLVDLDRSMDLARGLLDRLSNPNPAFHVARCLNSLLFRTPGAYEVGEVTDLGDSREFEISQDDRRVWVLIHDATGSHALPDPVRELIRSGETVTIYDLAAGLSSLVDAQTDPSNVLAEARGPVAIAGPRK